MSESKTHCFKLLKENPQWLSEDELLALLPLEDPREGVASLLERQAQLLRKENQALNETLRNFYDDAKHNEGLLDGLKEISLGLLRVQNFPDLIDAVPSIFEKDFHISKAMISIRDIEPLNEQVLLPEDAEDGFYLGETHPQWNEHIFKDKKIKSVAILALANDDDVLGHLFLGSHHEATFMATLSTDFLDWAGALLSEKIELLQAA